jgi:ABC-type nitrate/sulfonate/bicarbonate transport system substrate-binding protein
VFYINNSPGLVSAVRTGNVEAASAPEPFPSRAVQEGYATPMPPPYDTVLGPLPRALFMRTDYLEKNHDGAQRFMDAYVAAMKRFRDEPQVARDFALNDALKGEITPDDWDLSIKNQKWDVALDEKLLQTWADAMLRFHMVRQKLDMTQYSDLSLLRQAETKAKW